MLAKENIQKLIKISTRRLYKLREQQALKGIGSPPELLIEIEDLEAEIARLQEELAALESEVNDADLEALPKFSSPIERIKYYLYISKFKVDMLWSQIPREMKEGDIKDPDDPQRLHIRLNSVIKYLDEVGEVGTIDDPKSYFRGELPMSWGLIKGHLPDEYVEDLISKKLIEMVVYFGGYTEYTTLGLGGSAKHLTSMGESPPGIMSFSHGQVLLLSMGSELARKGDLDVLEADSRSFDPEMKQKGASYISWNTEATTHWFCEDRPSERVEFVAKTLARGTSVHERTDSLNVLLGTPIYVAMAD